MEKGVIQLVTELGRMESTQILATLKVLRYSALPCRSYQDGKRYSECPIATYIRLQTGIPVSVCTYDIEWNGIKLPLPENLTKAIIKIDEEGL